MDFDVDILDNLIMIALVITLLVLVYFRQRTPRREPAQRNGTNGGENEPVHAGQANAEDEQRPENRGLFPQPGDPDYAAWVAGGVGH